MLKSTNVSSLRSNLPAFLKDLDEGPLLIHSHSRPAAVMLAPEMFEALVEKLEMLEDLVDGRRAIADFRTGPDHAVDAEEVFNRLGQ